MATRSSNPTTTTTGASAYTVKPLVKDLPLSDGIKGDAHITCVEFWDGNLYVGTSLGELLHFVSLPSEDPTEDATFILASRLEPTPSPAPKAPAPGLQKILIIPRSKKACILSNNVLTFHSLPELSPAAGNRKVSGCQWMGGLDQDLQHDLSPGEDVVMIGLGGMIRILRIGEEVKGISKISFPGCLEAVRRGRFACVADAHHYALLDIENQQKIPLFPISSIDETPGATQVETLATEQQQTHDRSASASTLSIPGAPGGHRRQQSLGDRFIAGLQQAQYKIAPKEAQTEEENVTEPESGTRTPLQEPSQEPSPEPGRSQAASPKPPSDADKPLPQPPAQAEAERKEAAKKTELLRPHIVPVTSEEFLLTTGTGSKEPGVGMFVNLDGDVVRGTLEFAKYPSSVIVDINASVQDEEMPLPDQESEGYVIAAFARQGQDSWEAGLEIQRWDALGSNKSWLPLTNFTIESTGDDESTTGHEHVGVFRAFSVHPTTLTEISDRLKSRRLRMRPRGDVADTVPPSPATSTEDEQFWTRLNRRSSRLMCWSHDTVHLLVKVPLVVQLETSLQEVMARTAFQQDQLLQLVGRIQNMEVTSEAEFLSLAYMRQKISLVAFEDLIANRLNINPQLSEKLFVESDLDPRVILSMVPLFRRDIDEGASGIRLSQGLADMIEERLKGLTVSLDPDEVLSRPDDYDTLGLIKRYLFAWRKKKGFGSIADEALVFASVDAALLHLMLHQDARSGLFPGQMTTQRVELYAFLDGGVSCPERAIQLLEEYGRLYALSRLYGNRRESARVLHTWRRIMEGEGDAAGELSNADAEMRRYLSFLKDRALIEEYGAYLARRNPAFGVQVFTDESSKVRLPPDQVVGLLEERAPEAVKVYLEHLVFGKKNFGYANVLISHYLTSVLSVLRDEPDDGSDKSGEYSARTLLEDTYRTYRALAPPKPTYRQFIAENGAVEVQWWKDRLRLLELLGGTFGADFTYDAEAVQARISDYGRWLVPESIILDGRRGEHATALRLLTHGLGDYHTAVNYCMLGGASIFHPATAGAGTAAATLPDRDEQRGLFATLLREFLRLEDEEQRREQVGALLGRFEGWFAPEEVLPLIPESWPVEVIEGFLVGAIRRVVQEKAETTIVKALSGAENTIVTHEFAEKSQSAGPLLMTAGEEQVA